MLTVDQAFAEILRTVTPSSPVGMPLDLARGRVLAEEVISSVDSPPFDKSLMDGYAVTCDAAQRELVVVGEITAGQVAQGVVQSGTAVRIMTGAPLPQGTESIVRVEDTESLGHDRVRIHVQEINRGGNLIRRGAALQDGETVISTGQRLGPSQLGALAELGHHPVRVYPQPRVAVLATGDELVPYDQTPGPGQIRNSNELMLSAQVRQAGAEAVPLGIARDDRAELRERIASGLQCDILCLSGGVSAGILDLVPAVLQELGVREIFHKVRVKPGKPIWFGYRPCVNGTSPCYVFGLPGNPVSSLVCFELFVRTAIRRMQGLTDCLPRAESRQLTKSVSHHDPRPTYHPSRCDSDNGVELVSWQGSSDLRATALADSMTLLPTGPLELAIGSRVMVYRWAGDS